MDIRERLLELKRTELRNSIKKLGQELIVLKELTNQKTEAACDLINTLDKAIPSFVGEAKTPDQKLKCQANELSTIALSADDCWTLEEWNKLFEE